MTSRSELAAAATRWLRRQGDTDFDADVDVLIRNMEARLARVVRHTSMEIVTTLALAGRSATLPTDCLELRSLSLQGDTRKLDLVTMEVLHEHDAWNSTGGIPRMFAISDREVYFAPSGTHTLDLVYWARPAALVDDADTNYLLTNHFDLYLYALLAEAAIFLQDERAQVGYEARFSDALRTLLRSDGDYRHSGSVPRRIGSNFVV